MCTEISCGPNDKHAKISFSVRPETGNALLTAQLDVNKSYHRDNWLVAAATRSSDPNFRQSADNIYHANGGFTNFCRSYLFGFSEVDFFLMMSSQQLGIFDHGPIV